jgi:opacity protein-like surface antigen
MNLGEIREMHLSDQTKSKTVAFAATSTSALALLALTQPAMAEEGFYGGISFGASSGAVPAMGSTSDPEDYSLGGLHGGAFVGYETSTAGGMATGLELAWTGPQEGDPDNLSYEYAYDVIFNIDAKLRLGTTLGQFDVYGFAGPSYGKVNDRYYGREYHYWGVNVGAGAQMDLSDNMFMGAELIQRFTQGTEDGDAWSSNHGAISLRAGLKF